jgi:hypothetical protein
MDTELAKLKAKYSQMAREKDILLMRKETVEKFKNP